MSKWLSAIMCRALPRHMPMLSGCKSDSGLFTHFFPKKTFHAMSHIKHMHFRHTSSCLFFVRETFFIMITSKAKSVGNCKCMLPHSETSLGHQNSRIRIIFRSVPSIAMCFLTPGYYHLMLLTFPIFKLGVSDFRDCLEACFHCLHSKSDS